MMKWDSQFWFGGNATDQFVGIPNSFQSSKGLEVRKEARVAKLAHQPVRNSSAVIADWIMKFLTIQSTGDVIAFGDTGKIYRQTAGAGNFVLVYTDLSNRKIVSAYEFNGILYWATSGNIHKITVTNIDASWSGDVTEDYKAFANGNATYHPMIEVFNTLFIGDGKNLASLDSFGTWTNNKLSFFGDESVVGLTFNGTRIKIYNQRTSSIQYGRVYVWDGVSNTYNEFIELGGKTIHAVTSKDNVDYYLAGSKPALYAMVGYTSQLMKQLPDFADGNTATFNPNCMTSWLDLIYFGTVASGTNSINRGVWTWGAKDKEFPLALVNEYSTSNANASDLIGAIHVSNSNVYISWKNGSTFAVDVTDNAKYAATGEVVSRAWDGGRPASRKELIALKIACRQLAAGEKIDLYVRRDLSTSWGSPVITIDQSITVDQGVNFKELESNLLGEPFNFLEFRVVLTAGTSNATTPSLLGIQVLANPIQEIFES